MAELCHADQRYATNPIGVEKQYPSSWSISRKVRVEVPRSLINITFRDIRVEEQDQPLIPGGYRRRENVSVKSVSTIAFS